jgi:hypothetical protein
VDDAFLALGMVVLTLTVSLIEILASGQAEMPPQGGESLDAQTGAGRQASASG